MHSIRIFLVFILIASIPALSLAAYSPVQRLNVTYDPEGRTIEGTIELEPGTAGTTLYFLLLPNLGREENPYLSERTIDQDYPFGFEESGIEIESVSLVQSESETPVGYRLLPLPPAFQTYSLADGVLAVDLPEGGSGDLMIGFTLYTPRNSLGDDGVTDGVLTRRFGWYPLLIGGTDRVVEKDGTIAYAGSDWFPLILPSYEYEARLTVPEGYALFTGTDRVERSVEDGSVVYRIGCEGKARTLGITIAQGYETYTLDGRTPIEVAHLPAHEEEGRLIATYARDILAAYEARFGPYPRKRLTIVENPNARGTSFAADGIVWLSRLLFSHRDVPLPGFLNRLIEFVLAHEIAHQWFGLGTEVDLDADSWLSEGFAQYAAVSYFEGRYGPSGGNLFDVTSPGVVEDFVDRQFGYLNLREHQIEFPYLVSLWSGFDEELVKPTSRVEYANANATRIYDKGYLVARAIAGRVGADAFDRALKRAFETGRDERLTVAEFETIVEEEAGESVKPLFDAWVFGDDSVDYAVEIVSQQKTSGGYETKAVVSRSGGTEEPVVVEATLTSGATERKEWDGKGEEATIVFTTPSRVRRLSVDPDHILPDRNRLNNNDPVKVVTAVSRASLPLDAYVITPAPSSNGFSFSYLDRFRVTVEPSAATMVVKKGRGDRYTGYASIEDGRLTGNLTYTHIAYGQPEIGLSSGYWEPDIAYSIGLSRLFSDDRPLFAFRLGALDLPSITASRARSVYLDLTDGGAVRFSVFGYDEIRIAPRAYLEGGVFFGFSAGDLPSALRFRFTELHASPLLPAEQKLAGIVSLELPPEEETLPYNLFNLAMVDRRRTRVYIAGGVGWTTITDFGKTSPGVEAGLEELIDLSTLGGLLPMSVRLGVAVPIVGGGETVFYAEFSL